MKAEKKLKVCAIIVTYGNRYHFLSRVIEGAFIAGVTQVVVVDNDSDVTSRQKMIQLRETNSEQIHLILNNKNLGSAFGYKIGINYAASKLSCEFIWLLDDDNLPDKNALKELTVQIHKHPKLSNKSAFLSFREDRKLLKLSACGVSPEIIFPKESSFLSFNILNLPQKIFLRLRKNKRLKKKEIIKIPFAPYGGLLFHHDVVAEIGLPNESFFIYADDTEYTNRFRKIGGGVYLVPASKIKDIDKSWHAKSKTKNIFFRMLLNKSDFRVYYSVRNRIYFNTHYSMDKRYIYEINKKLFIIILFYLSLVFFKFKRFNLIISAVSDGENGRLGLNDKIHNHS